MDNFPVMLLLAKKENNMIPEVMCQKCNTNPALSFSCIGTPSSELNWKLTCHSCSDENERYYYQISVKDFFKSPSNTIDWMSHLNKKRWMNWNDFMKMMEFYRASINC